MSAQAVSTPPSPFLTELFEQGQPRRLLSGIGWGVALSAHVLAAGLAIAEQHEPPSHPTPPLEVEFAPPESPPPPAAVTPPPPVEQRAAPPVPVAKAVAAAAAPPEPARAGALLTAKADPAPAPQAEEPVDFTNDPGALGFGSGVVAVGGKAEVGAAHAQLLPSPASSGVRGLAPRASGEALTPVSDLSQKPALNESDPCRGYFPNGAADDVATAAVLVTLTKSGAVSSVQLLSETPAQQGFGAAARTCMASKHFSPGLDRDGKPTATAIRVNVRFAR